MDLIANTAGADRQEHDRPDREIHGYVRLRQPHIQPAHQEACRRQGPYTPGDRGPGIFHGRAGTFDLGFRVLDLIDLQVKLIRVCPDIRPPGAHPGDGYRDG